MKVTLICIVIACVACSFAQEVNYTGYAQKTKAFAKRISPFAGRIYTYSENNKNKQVFYTKALLALNNAETAHLSVKNLSDLLTYCSYTKRLKKDSKLRKDIIAYGHRRMQVILSEINKRFQWAADQVRKDETAGRSGNLTKILKQFVDEYMTVSPVIDKLAELVDPSARKPLVKKEPVLKPKETSPKGEKGKTATVLIFSIPPNAKVFMDGTFVGKTNLDKLSVTTGTHRMQFTVQGKVLTQDMTFKPGDNGKMFVTIE